MHWLNCVAFFMCWLSVGLDSLSNHVTDSTKFTAIIGLVNLLYFIRWHYDDKKTNEKLKKQDGE